MYLLDTGIDPVDDLLQLVPLSVLQARLDVLPGTRHEARKHDIWWYKKLQEWFLWRIWYIYIIYIWYKISLLMIYTYLSICLFVYLSIVYVSICLSIYLFIYLFIYVFIYLSTYLAIYLSVYLSICLSVCLSICLSIYQSIYLSIVHTCRYGLHTKLITYSWGARSEAGESWNMLWKGASTAGFGGCGETPIIKATFFVHSMLEIICISIFTYVYTHT